MLRTVVPELLDRLPANDPRAIHSRGDLQRINKIMGNAGIMARAIQEKWRTPVAAGGDASLSSIVELGGGDGTFLLELARRVAPWLGPARVILVDQQSLVAPVTRNALEAFSWRVEPVQADVFEWLSQHSGTADATIANLFLHHLDDGRLARLLHDISRQTRIFVACEPRRSGAALAAASLMGFIGCNSVSLHDGRISVRAGFRDRELSRLWPGDGTWDLEEHEAGAFTHRFIARQRQRGV